MRTILVLTLVLAAVTGLQAQQAPTLAVDRLHVDSLTAEEVDTFTVDLGADQFVLGEVDQRTVDVVITVYGPTGDRVARVDFSARGPEWFQFETDREGRHRVEVSPFEQQEGEYAVALRRVEPVATRPDDRVDQLMAAYSGQATPGGLVGVVRDGELVFARAYGTANLAYDIPFGLETKNNIGSTSKQFTAFAIALLAERGQLSLDDPVRDHVPELPAFDHTVTLRHLLTHTSGYREFLNAFSLAGLRVDEGDHIDRQEIIELVRRQPELQNEPGAEWNYNNTGFAILTVVVERVSGQPFPVWMAENVFGPLGMESTKILAHPGQIVENGAQGYMPAEDGGWREAADVGGSMGAGGIYTTLADLARWIDNFEDPTVGSPELFHRMTTRYVLADGDTTDYGLGLFVDEYRGLKRVHHGGADLAHRSMLVYFPELDAGVVVESNNATFNSGATASAVARAFFGEHMEEDEASDPVDGPDSEAEFDPAQYDPEDFDPLTGRYALAEAPSFVLSFFRDGDTLWTRATGQPRAQIEPTSDSTFRLLVVPASVTFHRNPDGTADSLTLHQNGAHVAHRLEGEVWEPSDDELDAYTGRYFSRELETFYTLTLEEGRLTLDHRRFDDPVRLRPGSEPDTFTGSFPVAEVEFVRDASGEVVALEASNGRTRGVRFDRMTPEPR